jgi:hypothetical protein
MQVFRAPDIRDEFMAAKSELEAALAEEADELRQAFYLAKVSAPRAEVEQAMRASDAARMRKVEVLRRVRLISSEAAPTARN